MQPITDITGTAAVIRRPNIDTDQIIPAVWMKRIERTGYQDGLFQSWRTDPAFTLNQPERAGASVLIAGPNFGCGSSRQHAVWALRDWGFRAVISSRIADIHRTNLPNEGLVPVQAAPDVVAALMAACEADPAADVRIDVASRTLTCSASGIAAEPFHLDDAAHYSLTRGFDPIDLTLQLSDLIDAHEAARADWLPAGRTVLPRGQKLTKADLGCS